MHGECQLDTQKHAAFCFRLIPFFTTNVFTSESHVDTVKKWPSPVQFWRLEEWVNQFSTDLSHPGFPLMLALTRAGKPVVSYRHREHQVRTLQGSLLMPGLALHLQMMRVSRKSKTQNGVLQSVCLQIDPNRGFMLREFLRPNVQKRFYSIPVSGLFPCRTAILLVNSHSILSVAQIFAFPYTPPPNHQSLPKIYSKFDQFSIWNTVTLGQSPLPLDWIV